MMTHPQIKALETRYAGRRFRSRLEARWAVFFDNLGIGWEHEPEGFATSAGNYLPDFQISVPDEPPHYPYWFEVKRNGFTIDADDRHARLARESRTPLIVATGMPGGYGNQHRSLWAYLPTDGLTPCGHCDRGMAPPPRDSGAVPAAFVGAPWRRDDVHVGRYGWTSIHQGRTWFPDPRSNTHVAIWDANLPADSPDVDRAYAAAQSARFGQ